MALRVCLQSCQPQPKGKQWKKEGIQGQEWVGGDCCKDGPKPVEFCPSSFLAFSHGEPAQHINEGAHGRSPHCRVPTEDLQSKGLHLRPCDQGSTSHCSQPKKKRVHFSVTTIQEMGNREHDSHLWSTVVAPAPTIESRLQSMGNTCLFLLRVQPSSCEHPFCSHLASQYWIT